MLSVWWGEFEFLRRKLGSGVYTLTMHPQVIGRGHRMLMLEELLDRIAAVDGVEFTTHGRGRDRTGVSATRFATEAIDERSDEWRLVTGASRGIGRACAVALARRGLRVAVHYHRDREAALDCAASLDGGPHTVVQADLMQAEQARSLVETVTRDCGRLDVVVNNAGHLRAAPVG